MLPLFEVWRLPDTDGLYILRQTRVLLVISSLTFGWAVFSDADRHKIGKLLATA